MAGTTILLHESTDQQDYISQWLKQTQSGNKCAKLIFAPGNSQSV